MVSRNQLYGYGALLAAGAKGGYAAGRWVGAKIWPPRRKKRRTRSLRKRVRKLEMSHEMKRKDTTLTISPDTTGSVSILTATALGDDENEREGLKIIPRGLYIKYFLAAGSSATVPITNRVILFYDTQQRGTIPSLSNLLKDVTVIGMRNIERQPRFKIMYDKVHTILPSGDRSQLFRRLYFKLKRIRQIYYGGDTSATADMGANQIYMATIGNTATASEKSTLSVESRFKFTD